MHRFSDDGLVHLHVGSQIDGSRQNELYNKSWKCFEYLSRA